MAWDKPGGFYGEDALKRLRDEGITQRCFSWVLDDPNAMVWGDEPLRMNGEIVGTASSVGFGHSVGAPVCLGYVSHPEVATKGFAKQGSFELQLGDRLIGATARVSPPFDPKHRRVQGDYSAA